MKDIILKWIGGEKANIQYLSGVTEAISGYNQALQDLRERTPELEKAILEEVKKEHTKHYIQKHFDPIGNWEHRGYRKAQLDIIKLLTSK